MANTDHGAGSASRAESMKTEHDLKVAIETRRAAREARLAAKEGRLAEKAAQETEGCIQEAMRRLIAQGFRKVKP